MMTPLMIQMIAGSQTGRRLSFNRSPLSFGRGGDNDLVVELPHASRRHGMLVFENGQWLVVNESPNGTTINGKKVGPRPQPLRSGDVVGVAKEPMFAVGFEPSAAPADPVASQAAVDPQADHLKRRSRLWLGIGIYLGVILIAMVVLSQVIQKKQNSQAKFPEPLTKNQITDALNQPLNRLHDARKAAQRLTDANTLFNQRTRSDETLYNCFIAYKESLAHANKTSFDSVVQLKYDQVRREFIDRLLAQYKDAYLALRNGQINEAENKLKNILLTYNYPKLPDVITRNIKQLLMHTKN